MAVIHLKDIWVHRSDDFLDFRVFRYVGGFTSQRETDSHVEKLAGGRLRVIRREGERTRWTLSLLHVPRPDVEWLRDQIGQIVMVRSHREKIFGTFPAVDATELVHNGLLDVSLVLDEVTFSEAAD